MIYLMLRHVILLYEFILAYFTAVGTFCMHSDYECELLVNSCCITISLTKHTGNQFCVYVYFDVQLIDLNLHKVFRKHCIYRAWLCCGITDAFLDRLFEKIICCEYHSCIDRVWYVLSCDAPSWGSKFLNGCIAYK